MEKKIGEIVDKELLEKIMQPVPWNIKSLGCINSARKAAEVQQAIDERNRYMTKKDAAIFQAAEESKKQNKLLSEQINTLKEQNKLLKEMYDGAKIDAEENKKQAKHNKIFGWVSFAVGTAIGIAGVLVGILL